METLKKMENVETLNKTVSSDFWKVPNLKFDIQKLRNDLEKFLKKRILIHWELKILEQFLLIKFLVINLLWKVIMSEEHTGLYLTKLEMKQ